MNISQAGVGKATSPSTLLQAELQQRRQLDAQLQQMQEALSMSAFSQAGFGGMGGLSQPAGANMYAGMNTANLYALLGSLGPNGMPPPPPRPNSFTMGDINASMLRDTLSRVPYQRPMSFTYGAGPSLPCLQGLTSASSLAPNGTLDSWHTFGNAHSSSTPKRLAQQNNAENEQSDSTKRRKVAGAEQPSHTTPHEAQGESKTSEHTPAQVKSELAPDQALSPQYHQAHSQKDLLAQAFAQAQAQAEARTQAQAAMYAQVDAQLQMMQQQHQQLLSNQHALQLSTPWPFYGSASSSFAQTPQQLQSQQAMSSSELPEDQASISKGKPGRRRKATRPQRVFRCPIMCGTLDSDGKLVSTHHSEFFGNRQHLFTASADTSTPKTILYKASLLAHKFKCATNTLAMYLSRRRNHQPGIYQATAFIGKPVDPCGLKIGSYFVSLEACKRFEEYAKTIGKPKGAAAAAVVAQDVANAAESLGRLAKLASSTADPHDQQETAQEEEAAQGDAEAQKEAQEDAQQKAQEDARDDTHQQTEQHTPENQEQEAV